MEGNQSVKTIIAEDVEIIGSVKSASDVHLAGKLNGDLTCQGQATIGETAAIKGNIAADSTSISGQVSGNVTAKDRIELKSTARLNGDIRSKRLTVEDGVTFVGKSEVNPSGAAASRTAGGPDARLGASDEEAAESAPQEPEEKAKSGGMFGKK